MSRINTNIAAINAVHNLARNQDDLKIRLHRLSTGLRINRGADDPAGLIVSERLRSEIRGIQQAIENSGRASNVVSTAEGALNEVSALLLDLQSLVTAAANEAGLTDDEVRANQQQIDSILNSLDRISNTTEFAGKKLLNGNNAYLTSGVPQNAFAAMRLFGIQLPQVGSRELTIRVTQSAQTAQLALIGTNTTGPSTTSATTISIKGTLGSELLSFASGTTLAQVLTAINATTAATGVSAVVSAAGVAGVASALLLNSTTLGSDAFVSVEPIGGSFVAANNSGATLRDEGVDAGVLVNGQVASVRGLRADVRAAGIDARFYLTQSFGQTLSAATFSITGGGSVFQITPEISSAGQIQFGLDAVSTLRLGDPTTGLLYTLRTGGANELASLNHTVIQTIVDEAIDQVSAIRGRFGNIQRNQIDPSVASQSIALENVMASESIIRDADIAVEVSALTRAQILVQSTQSTLQIANSIPNLVLSLLG